MMAGRVTIYFLPELHRELARACQPERVTEARLAGWLCPQTDRQQYRPSQPDRLPEFHAG